MDNPFEVILSEIRQLKVDLQKISQFTPAPPAEIIDRKELCNRLGISEPSAIKFKGPSFRVGNSVRYNWTKVIEYLEKSKKKSC